MAKKPTNVPDGFTAMTPYLVVKGAAAAIEFYRSAFGAKEHYRLKMGDKIGHAELDISGARFMLSDEFPEHGSNPLSLGGSSVSFAVYVADADAAMAKAIKAGAKLERAAETHFYGDRSGRVVDPFGHRWSIQQHLEKVSPREMQKRLDAMMAPTPPASTARKSPSAKGKTK